MNFMIRLSAYSASALFGALVPLVTAPGPTEADTSHSLAFHSSSRALAVEAPMTTAELEDTRNQIWALTSANAPD